MPLMVLVLSWMINGPLKRRNFREIVYEFHMNRFVKFHKKNIKRGNLHSKGAPKWHKGIYATTPKFYLSIYV